MFTDEKSRIRISKSKVRIPGSGSASGSEPISRVLNEHWSTPADSLVSKIGGIHPRPVYDLDWSSSGQIVTVGGDDSLRIFRQAAGSCHKCLALRTYRYVSVIVNISLWKNRRNRNFSLQRNRNAFRFRLRKRICIRIRHKMEKQRLRSQKLKKNRWHFTAPNIKKARFWIRIRNRNRNLSKVGTGSVMGFHNTEKKDNS